MWTIIVCSLPFSLNLRLMTYILYSFLFQQVGNTDGLSHNVLCTKLAWIPKSPLFIKELLMYIYKSEIQDSAFELLQLQT